MEHTYETVGFDTDRKGSVPILTGLFFIRQRRRISARQMPGIHPKVLSFLILQIPQIILPIQQTRIRPSQPIPPAFRTIVIVRDRGVSPAIETLTLTLTGSLSDHPEIRLLGRSSGMRSGPGAACGGRPGKGLGGGGFISRVM